MQQELSKANKEVLDHQDETGSTSGSGGHQSIPRGTPSVLKLFFPAVKSEMFHTDVITGSGFH